MTTANTISDPFALIDAKYVCEYCGKPLKTTSVEVNGRVYGDLPCWGSCGCEPSQHDGDQPERTMTKEERYARAGIGAEYQKSVGESAEFQEALRHRRNVLVAGPNGTGKSMLAARTAMDMVDQGEDVLFVNAASEAEHIKRSFDGEGNDHWERMCDAGYLFVDDFGKGNPTEWEASMWYAVFEARYSAGLPTMVTTNYGGGELISRLTVNGDDSTARAIVSRIRGGALTKRMEGSDMRLSR